MFSYLIGMMRITSFCFGPLKMWAKGTVITAGTLVASNTIMGGYGGSYIIHDSNVYDNIVDGAYDGFWSGITKAQLSPVWPVLLGSEINKHFSNEGKLCSWKSRQFMVNEDHVAWWLLPTKNLATINFPNLNLSRQYYTPYLEDNKSSPYWFFGICKDLKKCPKCGNEVVL